MKRVLITGASTSLGEVLIDRLLNDYMVECIFALCEKNYPLSIQENDRLKVFEISMRKQRRVNNLLFGPAKEAKIDTLVHTAKVQSSYKRGAAVHHYNVGVLRSMLDVAERHPTIKRMILCSGAEVYQVQRDLPSLIAEQHPLNMNEGAPQWICDRVEADVMACTRMGLSNLKIAVLRMAEILAPGAGSQFFDYLQTPVCLCPIGFDPMLNFLTLDDAAAALQKSIHAQEHGIFNIPGADTLPLSSVIAKWGRIGLPVPNFIAHQSYRVRRMLRRGEFRYGMNRRRFHFTGILDGRRAEEILGYIPSHPINWPINIME